MIRSPGAGRPPRGAAIGVVAFALSAVAMVAALAVWATSVQEPWTPDIVLYPAAYLAFGAVGASIVAHQPRNTVGLLAVATGLLGSIVGLCDSIGRAAGVHPIHDWAAWFATWGFPVTLGPPLLLILVFPTGRPASGRWRLVAVMVVIGVLTVGLGNAFTPQLADHPLRVNPFGVSAFTGSALESGGVGWFLVLAGAAAGVVGLVPRLRRARGVEREQLKWLTYAATLHGAAWILVALDLPGAAGEGAVYGVFLTLLLIPAATGIAIRRYRLYEIDRVISRSIAYGAVTVLLFGLFAFVNLGTQALLGPFVQGSTIGVAISTLIVAAAFNPLRVRLQRLVDRRFNRARYDQERTLEHFAAGLREELDVDRVLAHVRATIDHAVEPRTVGVWRR